MGGGIESARSGFWHWGFAWWPTMEMGPFRLITAYCCTSKREEATSIYSSLCLQQYARILQSASLASNLQNHSVARIAVKCLTRANRNPQVLISSPPCL